MMIKVASCVPPHLKTRRKKVEWMRRVLDTHEVDMLCTPQEFFGGHVGMPDEMHMKNDWVLNTFSKMAKDYGVALGVGAASGPAGKGAMEEYFYFDKQGTWRGSHRKFALPSYDDVRSNGAGELWPEISFKARTTPIEIPELGLKIGTVFCWEVFSLTIFPAYSMAGVNFIMHPIKFAPRGWPKLSKRGDKGKRSVIGFAQEPKSTHWEDKLVMASRHEVFCPIMISCNTWAIGEEYKAFCGHVDELLGTTEIAEVPSDGKSALIHIYEFNPAIYTGMDHLHSMGAFKEHVGDIAEFHRLGAWKMHAKVRRIEAHLIGDTTRLDCQLKAVTLGRQKKSTRKRAHNTLGGSHEDQ